MPTKSSKPRQSSSPQQKNLSLIITPFHVIFSEHTKNIVQNFISKNSDSTSYDLKQTNLAALKDALQSQSLFTKSRLFLLKNAESLTAAKTETLTKILSIVRNDPSTHVILHALKLDKRSPLRKITEEIYEITELKTPELKVWIETRYDEYTKKYLDLEKLPKHLKLNKETVELLIQSGTLESGDINLDFIARNIEVLVTYCDAPQQITGALQPSAQVSLQQAATSLFNVIPKTTEFEFVNAVIEHDTLKSRNILRQLLTAKKSPFLLIVLLQRTITTLLQIRTLLEQGMNAHQVREHLNIQPWLFSKHLKSIERHTSTTLTNLLYQITKVDALLKNRSLGEELIFENLF
jgi:DNA polymerase III delta subunit